jgi:hypothetical protein
MKTMKTILAAAIGIALATAAATAVGAMQDEKDSVYSWGPWAKMVSPAAGPQGVGFLSFAGLYEYEPALVVQNEGLCAAGGACGFATYRVTYSSQYQGGEFNLFSIGGYDGGESSRYGYVPAMFGATGETGDPGWITPLYNVSFNVVPMNETAVHPAVTSTEMNGAAYWLFGSTYFSVGGQDGGQHSGLSGVYLDELAGAKGSDQYFLLATGWSDKTTEYSDCVKLVADREGAFVYGVTPTLEALHAGSVTAAYSGHAMYSGVPVVINVNLGNSTWNGSWNNGVDGFTHAVYYANGTYRTGQVGFDASGTINGVNITSTSVSASDAETVSGNVTGAFFGTSGQSLAGVSDVTKDGQRNVDLFVTQLPQQKK